MSEYEFVGLSKKIFLLLYPCPPSIKRLKRKIKSVVENEEKRKKGREGRREGRREGGRKGKERKKLHSLCVICGKMCNCEVFVLANDIMY